MAAVHREGLLSVEAEKCSICEQEMTPLPVTTENKGITIFVCTKPKGKAKIPCDGSAYILATRDE